MLFLLENFQHTSSKLYEGRYMFSMVLQLDFFFHISDLNGFYNLIGDL